MHAPWRRGGGEPRRRRADEKSGRGESSRVGPRNASAHAPPIRTVCTLLARAARRARALANMSERIAPTAATATAPVYLLALRHSLAWRVKIRALLLARATCTDRLARLVNRPATRYGETEIHALFRISSSLLVSLFPFLSLSLFFLFLFSSRSKISERASQLERGGG